MVHGLCDTRALVERIRRGEAGYDFTDVMAGPRGCVDGGGFLRSKKKYLPLAKARRETIPTVDRKAKEHQSHNTPQVQTLYKEFLGEPDSEKAHELLHTQCEDRKRELYHPVKEIRDDITIGSVVYRAMRSAIDLMKRAVS